MVDPVSAALSPGSLGSMGSMLMSDLSAEHAVDVFAAAPRMVNPFHGSGDTTGILPLPVQAPIAPSAPTAPATTQPDPSAIILKRRKTDVDLPIERRQSLDLVSVPCHTPSHVLTPPLLLLDINSLTDATDQLQHDEPARRAKAISARQRL